MEAVDKLFLGEERKSQEKVGASTRKGSAFVNHQDHLGRTALHSAIAFNNKIAAETLLYLGANPHLNDVFGQRPLDICYVDALKSLLESKMHSYKSYVAQDIDLDKVSSLS